MMSDPEIADKVEELKKAVKEGKDPKYIKKIANFIIDKGTNFAVALLSGSLLK